MNVFLVGNGFDLHHKFPTGYLNFLNTMKFLVEKYDDTFTTVAHVFGNSDLQETDCFIKECYEQHSGVYKNTALPQETVRNMVNRIKENLWFKYLCKSVNQDIKWIDFEKEITKVLNAFTRFLECEKGFNSTSEGITFSWAMISIEGEDRHILSQFDLFYEQIIKQGPLRFRINEKYLIEHVAGSGAYYFASNELASDLYKSLRELTDVLKDYLLCFVDEPSKEYDHLGIEPRFHSLPTPNRVYTFNYTNTFQILYNNSMVDHIHGNTNTNIVLGINPDENDEVESVDTTFLQFKKYFQRVFFNTDMDFLQNMNFIKRSPTGNDNKLYVIGHSLDSTDEDVIKQIFESAKTIIILYHNDTAVKDRIRNLVEIYGKEGLDQLRQEKNLVFLPQSEIQWVAPK